LVLVNVNVRVDVKLKLVVVLVVLVVVEVDEVDVLVELVVEDVKAGVDVLVKVVVRVKKPCAMFCELASDEAVAPTARASSSIRVGQRLGDFNQTTSVGPMAGGLLRLPIIRNHPSTALRSG